MKQQLIFTPGPSQLYPTVPMHLQRGLEEGIFSLSHRSAKAKEIVKIAVTGLRELLAIPDDYYVVFVGSATEAMERIIQNTVREKSFHLMSGAFAKKFTTIASELGKQTETYNVLLHEELSDKDIVISEDAELICVTQNETSNGWACPVDVISSLHKKYPKKLLAVDIVSAAPYISLDMAQVDMAFFSVQKGFGLPAGLGILIISPRAYEKSLQLQKEKQIIGSFHNFPSLIENMQDYQTPETPNMLGIYLLGQVVKDMLKIGRQQLQRETEAKADLLYAALEAHCSLQPFIKEKRVRSQTVIVAQGGDIESHHARFQRQGLTAGKGYGKYKDHHLRIANFPTHTLEDMQRLAHLLS
jgi:phosphoserine aminotransferase